MPMRIKYYVQCDERGCYVKSKLYVKQDAALVKALEQGFSRHRDYPTIYWCGIHAPLHSRDIEPTETLFSITPLSKKVGMNRSYGLGIPSTNARIVDIEPPF